MANKRKNNNINTNNDELLETNKTENLTSEEEIKETEEHIQTVEKADETEAKEVETTVEQTITEVKEEPVATEIKEEPVVENKEKASFKSFFKYKNGKPIKYVEDNNFSKEMKTIAKQRGYYEDIFKTNVLN